MKNINVTIGKLIEYAHENLMLDALDHIYALNRLSELCGVVPKPTEVVLGDEDYSSLLAELRAQCPGVDTEAVTDLLLPQPHMVAYYFNDEYERKPEKAFDFIFELYSACGSAKRGEAREAQGFIHYTDGVHGDRAIAIPSGSDYLNYTPAYEANGIAYIDCPDFMVDDILSREAELCEMLGGVVCKTMGDDNRYMSCKKTALTSAKVKKTVKSDLVKVELLDYPAPAVRVSGPKNSAIAQAAKILREAADKKVPCVCAAEKKEYVNFYIVYAEDAKSGDLVVRTDALTLLGVAATPDFSPLVPVLVKGTALSTDLSAFKPVYNAIGGVKYGSEGKALAAIDELVAGAVTATIKAAAVAEDVALSTLSE